MHRAHVIDPGIIPAYAGNTNSIYGMEAQDVGSSPHTRGTPRGARPSSRAPWDHPRIRGEHSARYSGIVQRDGIIPAYAGNTT